MPSVGEYQGGPFGELGVVGGEVSLACEEGGEVVFAGEFEDTGACCCCCCCLG